MFIIHKPEQINDQEIKPIGRYIRGTSIDGMIIKPDLTLKLDCFVDVDFAGLSRPA